MSRRVLVALFVTAVVTAVWHVRGVNPRHGASAQAGPQAVSLPLMFEPSTGGAEFVARGRGYVVAVTRQGARFHADDLNVALGFDGGGGTLRAERPLPTVINHLQGSPSEWRTGIRPFGAVRLERVYDGIDAVFYGNDRHVEYDLVVAPGAQTDLIRLRFDGVDAVELRDGDLQLRSGSKTLTHQAPVAYQEIRGRRVSVGARYVVAADRSVSFSVGAYDTAEPLVIDPTIIYSTYFGATGLDVIEAMAADAAGNLYVAGNTAGGDLPGSTSTLKGTGDAYLAKLRRDGTVAWVNLLGGERDEGIKGLAIGATGEPYVTGASWSADFPTTPGAWRAPVSNTCDTFVTHFTTDGTIAASTMLGGPQPWGMGCGSSGIAIDAQGRPVVAGSTASWNFVPTRTDSYGPLPPGLDQPDGFVARFSSDLSRIEVSRLIAGSGFDWVNGAALDQYGNMYIVGSTTSSDFPAVNAYRAQKYEVGDSDGSSGYDGFMTMVREDGTIGYSTYIGGSREDSVNAVVIGHYDRPFIAGTTESAETWFYKPSPVGQKSGFLFEMVPNSTGIVSGSAVGGSGVTHVRALAVGQDQAIWVVGATDGAGFEQNAPDDPKPQSGPGGGFDMFVQKRGTQANYLTYSYLLGGPGEDGARAVALDDLGDIYVGGTSTGGYRVVNAMQPEKRASGSVDGVITKLGCYIHPSLPVDEQPASGGPASWWVYAAEGCVIRPVSTADWLHVTGVSDGTVSFTTDPNPTANRRAATIVLSGKQVLPIFQAAGTGGGTTTTDEIVLNARDVGTVFGEWSVVPDSIHGEILTQPDRGTPKIGTPALYPSNWFDFTFTADAGKPYHLWIHGRAQNDSWQNDSIYAQFSDAVDASGNPIFRIGTTSATWVSLEECGGCGEQGWGWQDNAYGSRGDLGPDLYFATSGTHTIRFQTREDGFEIGQVVLSARAYLRTAPGGNVNDPTIVTGGSAPPPAAIDEIVLWPGYDAASIQWAWQNKNDPTAAGQVSVWYPDLGAPKSAAPSANPGPLVDINFNADAGKPYHLWLRMKADNDDWHNDSVWVQFSGSVDASGSPVYRVGTTSGTWVSLEECSGCGEQGWGWQDNAYGSPGNLGPPIYFAASGPQTIRIQVREDGLAIDQIVLSAVRYATTAPGTNRNDATILPRTPK